MKSFVKVNKHNVTFNRDKIVVSIIEMFQGNTIKRKTYRLEIILGFLENLSTTNIKFYRFELKLHSRFFLCLIRVNPQNSFCRSYRRNQFYCIFFFFNFHYYYYFFVYPTDLIKNVYRYYSSFLSFLVFFLFFYFYPQ